MMLAVLARASLEGAVVAALVWIAIRCLPRLSPATRAALWWCAAAKFLLALVWVTPVELPVLPARTVAPAALSRSAQAPVAGTALELGTPVQPAPVVNAPWTAARSSHGRSPARALECRPRCRGSHRSAPADADASRRPAFQPGDGADGRDRRQARRCHRPSPDAHGAYFQRDGHAAARGRPASAHPSARKRRHAALGRRGADGVVPRALARQAGGSLARAGAGGRRAALLLSSARAAGLARVPAVPGSGVRRGRDRHARDQPAGLRPAAPVARRVASPLEPRRRRRLIIVLDAETENCHASRFVAVHRSAGG